MKPINSQKFTSRRWLQLRNNLSGWFLLVYVLALPVTALAAPLVVTLPGTFQDSLGCPSEWDPSCDSVRMDGPNGNGHYTFSTSAIPPGRYEFKIAIDHSWAENYGLGGVRDGGNMKFPVPNAGDLVSFDYDPVSHIVIVLINGALPFSPKAEGMWLKKDLIAVQKGSSTDSFVLKIAAEGNILDLDAGGNVGNEEKSLSLSWLRTISPVTDADIIAKHPYLAGFNLVRIDRDQNGAAFPSDDAKLDFIRNALKRSVGIQVIRSSDNTILEGTQLQIAEAIDDVYAHFALTEPLGAIYNHDANTISLRLWAPTATGVFALLGPNFDFAEMVQDPVSGVWRTVEFPRSTLDRQFYAFCVTVYNRHDAAWGNTCDNFSSSTDPYAKSMVLQPWGQVFSQAVDLTDTSLMPNGWSQDKSPAFGEPEDAVITELHLRDFSSADANIPESLRGTYSAFTVDSQGKDELIDLQKAGLTHVQIMPVQEFLSAPEMHGTGTKLSTAQLSQMSAAPSNSTLQRDTLLPILNIDDFNWGYDPLQYFVPKGGYASDPNDASRVRELRAMVAAFHKIGLRVVLDLVFNHQSVGASDIYNLSRIVPDYYFELVPPNALVAGSPGDEVSEFGPNPATGLQMVDRLITDATLMFAKDYKVDGFRFDIMSVHAKTNMMHVRNALNTLNAANDGIDGKKILLFGEGFVARPDPSDPWNKTYDYREPRSNAAALAGTGIGSFNWSLEAASPDSFSENDDPRAQGFITGLGFDENGYYPYQNTGLFSNTDVTQQQLTRIRVGLTGSLADYIHQNAYSFGRGILPSARGDQLLWVGINHFDPGTVTLSTPADKLVKLGNAKDPQESIAYIDDHDGYTLFDMVMLKAPLSKNMDERVRMHNLGVDLTMLSQGIPFFLAGTEFLRSKSGDSNSYNSGDWFNALDYSLLTNTWTKGLPFSASEAVVDVHNVVLDGPTTQQMQRAKDHFKEMLEVRRNVDLFRLHNSQDIISGLKFYNTGTDAIPGLIVMSITRQSSKGVKADDVSNVVVFFNASDKPVVDFKIPSLTKNTFRLHEIQAASSDQVVRTSSYDRSKKSFFVPPRTTAVFVDRHDARDK